MLDFLKEIVQEVPDPTNGGVLNEQEKVRKRKGRGPAKPKAPKGTKAARNRTTAAEGDVPGPVKMEEDGEDDEESDEDDDE